MTDSSFPGIGEAFGRDYSTVIHSLIARRRKPLSEVINRRSSPPKALAERIELCRNELVAACSRFFAIRRPSTFRPRPKRSRQICQQRFWPRIAHHLPASDFLR